MKKVYAVNNNENTRCVFNTLDMLDIEYTKLESIDEYIDDVDNVLVCSTLGLHNHYDQREIISEKFENYKSNVVVISDDVGFGSTELGKVSFLTPEFEEKDLLGDEEILFFDYTLIHLVKKTTKSIPYDLFELMEPHFKEPFLRTKHFLTMNRFMKKHREYLRRFLDENNFLDKGYCSFLEVSSGEPIILDNQLEEHRLSVQDPLLPNYVKFFDSYFSIVTESTFGRKESGFYFSEKTWKPVRMFHPFLIVGKPKIHQLFKLLGFEYYDIFNYKFDNVLDDNKRIELLFDELKKMIEKPITEVRDLYCNESTIERMKHNYNHAQKLVDKQLDTLRRLLK